MSIPSVQHTSMLQRRNAAHHFQHGLKILAVAHLAPRRAHAESRRALCFARFAATSTSAGSINSCRETPVS